MPACERQILERRWDPFLVWQAGDPKFQTSDHLLFHPLQPLSREDRPEKNKHGSGLKNAQDQGKA